MHASFLKEYGLTSVDVPIVHFRPGDPNQPFVGANGGGLVAGGGTGGLAFAGDTSSSSAFGTGSLGASASPPPPPPPVNQQLSAFVPSDNPLERSHTGDISSLGYGR
eukprot:1471899-Prymnesium_polylepis.1